MPKVYTFTDYKVFSIKKQTGSTGGDRLNPRISLAEVQTLQKSASK
ncbi:hypothetical protein [Roseofilum capinflatum]|uniref:Uncharacterized protein n=1 Tax=Roseofilum capinflatum BLCC-M114 TaxID=3022440 RepID=A0ABT7BBP6_9CYAN|nr:hypothetical protein [Roseofilum capinflatum]MDJ1176609.1 hypothetical protein [Roseofilum capinflatum BLCC-M114]